MIINIIAHFISGLKITGQKWYSSVKNCNHAYFFMWIITIDPIKPNYCLFFNRQKSDIFSVEVYIDKNNRE